MGGLGEEYATLHKITQNSGNLSEINNLAITVSCNFGNYIIDVSKCSRWNMPCNNRILEDNLLSNYKYWDLLGRTAVGLLIMFWRSLMWSKSKVKYRAHPYRILASLYDIELALYNGSSYISNTLEIPCVSSEDYQHIIIEYVQVWVTSAVEYFVLKQVFKWTSFESKLKFQMNKCTSSFSSNQSSLSKLIPEILEIKTQALMINDDERFH